MGRHRTTRMIMSLPDAGGVLLAPSDDIRLELLRMLLELRGPEFDARCEVVVVTCKDDLRALKKRTWRHLAYDHTFEAFCDPNLFAFVRGWVLAWNKVVDERVAAA